jgi:ABC-2 type transport system ATP-binding protein
MGDARRAFVEQPDLTRDFRAATAAGPAKVAAEAMLSAVPRRRVEPIVIDRLSKSFNGKPAVRNLSFIVEPGVVTGFLGPNGAGKTTTLRMLVGLAEPNAGTATFGPYAYADLPHPQQTVGCVLEANFHPGRTGRNHLRVLAATADVDDDRVDELLRLMGLTQAADRPAGGYSMGMRQRLALAGALLGDPDYLILDEPANGLDPEGIRWLRAFLRNFASQGRTVLMSSHLLNEVGATADDIVIINAGRLVKQATMAELGIAEVTSRVRVSHYDRAERAIAELGAAIERGTDEQGPFLRVRTSDLYVIGAALFNADVAVFELTREPYDLEEQFFEMLEAAG